MLLLRCEYSTFVRQGESIMLCVMNAVARSILTYLIAILSIFPRGSCVSFVSGGSWEPRGACGAWRTVWAHILKETHSHGSGGGVCLSEERTVKQDGGHNKSQVHSPLDSNRTSLLLSPENTQPYVKPVTMFRWTRSMATNALMGLSWPYNELWHAGKVISCPSNSRLYSLALLEVLCPLVFLANPAIQTMERRESQLPSFSPTTQVGTISSWSTKGMLNCQWGLVGLMVQVFFQCPQGGRGERWETKPIEGEPFSCVLTQCTYVVTCWTLRTSNPGGSSHALNHKNKHTM